MKFLKVLRTLINHADFFSTTELIRYRQEPDFKTFTGGVFSIAIVSLLAVIFTSMSLSAVNREHIEWSSQMLKDTIPPPLTIPFSTFNIGVELEGFNLSAPLKYFDVVMTLFQFKNKILVGGGTRIPLSTCRRQDWALNEDILGNFDRMNATNWLCPSVEQSLKIQGKWASDEFTFISIDVLQCGSVDKGASCASPQQIDKVLTNVVHYSVYYINKLIAPDQHVPISYYMEDKDYIYFGKNLGSANYIFISDYQITTDHSILPYTDQVTETGGVVVLPTTISIQQVANGWYGSFVFRKSTNRYVYKRSFTKFDTVISYIGGLFGAIIGVLFLMNHYTRTNFEICLGSSIYQNEEDESLIIKTMSFCQYLGYLLFLCLNAVGYKPEWEAYGRFHKCRVEIQKHLDIKLILDKLNFLERAVCSICREDKYRALHLRAKMTIKEAEKYREYYSLRQQIINAILRRKKEKKLRLEARSQAQVENEMSSPGDLEKDSPVFNFRDGKVMPADEIVMDKLPDEDCRGSIQQQGNQSSSHNTMKFTKTTRRHILQNKSNLSDHLSRSQNCEEEQIIVPQEVAQSLLEVWKQALHGDNFSQEIWNVLDEDVRVIIQHQMPREEGSSELLEKSHRSGIQE